MCVGISKTSEGRKRMGRPLKHVEAAVKAFTDLLCCTARTFASFNRKCIPESTRKSVFLDRGNKVADAGRDECGVDGLKGQAKTVGSV